MGHLTGKLSQDAQAINLMFFAEVVNQMKIAHQQGHTHPLTLGRCQMKCSIWVLGSGRKS